MPRLKFNLNEIPDIVEVPKGKYRARLASCIKGESRSSGNPVLTWTWKILNGEAKGQNVKSWTSLQDHALSGLKEHLLALGLKGTVDVATDRLIGKTVVLIIGKRAGVSRSGEKAMFSSILAVLPSVKSNEAPPKVIGKMKTKTARRKAQDKEEDEEEDSADEDEDEDEEDEEDDKSDDDDDDDLPF